ncbi:MAG: hypothetical protein HZA24_11740 [Nitrospirae bacterium]|nr:hypothetical protein [Nitrospirota bacterium]
MERTLLWRRFVAVSVFIAALAALAWFTGCAICPAPALAGVPAGAARVAHLLP